MNLYSDPAYPQGDSGWFLGGVPMVWLETDVTVNTQVYYSLGVASNHTLYQDSTADWTDSLIQSIDFVINMATTDSLPGLTVYVSDQALTSGGPYVSSMCIQWSAQVPTAGPLVPHSDNGTALAGPPYVLTGSGYFEITDIRGYAVPLGANQYGFSVGELDLYAGSEKLVEVHTLVGLNGLAWSGTEGGPLASVYFNHSKRWLYYCYYEYDRVDPAYPTDYYYKIKIPYQASDFPDGGQFTLVPVVVGQESGAVSIPEGGVAGVDMTAVHGKPSVDFLAVSRSEGATGIVGHVSHILPVGGVEIATERVVPDVHLRFAGNSLKTDDGDFPMESSGTTFVAGPFVAENQIANTAVSANSSTVLKYDPTLFSPDKGTLDMWFSPAITGSAVLFEVSVSGAPDKMVLGISNGSTLYFSVTDSAGVVHTLSTACGTGFHQCKAAWACNAPGEDYVRLTLDGTEVHSTGLFIPFVVGNKWDLTSVTAAAAGEQDKAPFDALYVGCSRTAQTYTGSIALADVRLTRADDTTDFHTSTVFSGWRAVQAFSTVTNMFSYTAAPANDAAYVCRFRPVGLYGERQPASFFHTPLCRPVLVRGTYSGVDTGDAKVKRFRLIDATGEFDPLVFQINPQSFQVSQTPKFNLVSAISGRNMGTDSPAGSDCRTLGFDNITRTFYKELLARSESRNPFFLIDHDDKVYFGRFVITSQEEIIAKVPSRYKVQCDFYGLGGRYDYEMG